MACASAACASTAANATVEVSNATSTSGDLGDPLLSLARDPSLPRELRARVRAASRELADAGLATLAATAGRRAPPAAFATPSVRSLCAAPSGAHLGILEALSRVSRGGMRTDDGLGASAYLHVCEEMRSLAAAATACERIKTSPMPLGYVSALRAFLVLWLVCHDKGLAQCFSGSGER